MRRIFEDHDVRRRPLTGIAPVTGVVLPGRDAEIIDDQVMAAAQQPAALAFLSG